MKVLYVENHAVFAAGVTREFLSGCNVTVVPSLAAARGAWRAGRFGLVLVDYDLDDGKGEDFIRELRAEGSRVPIIGVSSHEEGNAALSKAGASAICSKMNFDKIQNVIATVLPGLLPAPHSTLETETTGIEVKRLIGKKNYAWLQEISPTRTQTRW